MTYRPGNRKITDEQLRAALEAHGGNRTQTAKALGMRREHITKRAAKIYATSTLIKGGEGDDFALQWVKEKAVEQTRDQIIEGVRDALKSLKPLPRIKAPKRTYSDLLAVYPMGDPHFGQYSWAEETGEDYDLAIAEQLHVAAMDHLVSRAPEAETALLINIGDYFHANDSKNVTPQSKHSLDVDTRHRKVIAAGVRAERRMIERALEKHKTVRVINVPGNHDPEAHIVLPIALGLFYENNPRVQIDSTPAKFIYHRHGGVLIGATHGDTCKLEKLGELMACDMRKEWGETEHHHWFTGHVHHKRFYEGPGFTAESLRTLAGKDAYAASHAYRARRDMQAVIFDRLSGEKERYRADASYVRAA